MSNIIIVCDENAICETLKSNLMLLRKFDSVLTCDFISSPQIINQNNAGLIILYSNIIDKKILNFIKNFNNLPILFVTDEISDENLLAIYEAGVTDYIITSKSQTEFLIKAMYCLKRGADLKKAERNFNILSQIGIFKKGTEFFSQKYSPAVFKSLLKLYKNNTASLMAIAPDINMKNQISLDFLASVLEKNLREDDIIGFYPEKLYVLLPNTNKQGALDVYNKIKGVLDGSCTVSAGIIETDKTMTFDFISTKANEALTDALLLKNSVVVQENLTSDLAMNWLDKSNKKHKNFKLFKKALLKKIETAIAPVFYQKQQIAEQRLFEVDVEQYSNEKESRFTLKKEGVCSIFELTYPGAVKIDLYIYKNIYTDNTPEYQCFELPKVNEKLISDLLDKFIKDFDKK